MTIEGLTVGMRVRYRGEVVRVTRIRRSKAQVVRAAGLRWVPIRALEGIE